MQAINVIKDQLEEYKPKLEAEFSRYAEMRLEGLIKTYGPDLKGRDKQNKPIWSASTQTGKMWLERTKPLTRVDEKGHYELDPAKLAATAKQYADNIVEAWFEKIQGKLLTLDEAQVHKLDGFRFNVSGVRDGKKIRIEQNMIINHSALGKMFNQFPSRIYVDGGFVSEASYKKLFGADVEEKAAAEEKRQANMLTLGTFAKGDRVQVKLKRGESSFYTRGKVVGEKEKEGKVLVRTREWGLFAIELERLIRWQNAEAQ